MDTAPIVITGASGGLGWHLCRYFVACGADVVGTYATHRPELPGCRVEQVRLERPRELADFVRAQPCGAFIHTAAMTSPDACERQPELAGVVNVEATRQIVAHLPSTATLLFMSTDLVFDGRTGHYREADPPSPINAYGRSKLAAEEHVAQHPGGTVVRLAKLYGDESPYHGSFESWIRAQLDAGGTVPLFEDELRTPIYVGDVARALERLVRARGPFRLYHLGGPDRVSRLEFGQHYVQCFGLDRTRLIGSSAAARGGVARGSDCSLDSSRFYDAFRFTPATLPAGLAKLKAGDY